MVEDKALDWDDVISNDGVEFNILPAGEYPFKVKSFERAEHNGSANLPKCKVAKVNIEIDGGDLGKAYVIHRFFLHSRTEPFICQFFRSINLRKSGDKSRMDWNAIIGGSGHCRVGVREYNDNQYNDIKTFLDSKNNDAGFTAGTF